MISGHLGWVRSLAFDPSNEWFATGSVDRTIKVSMTHSLPLLPQQLCLLFEQIWDLAKCCAGAEGGLKLTLTGHIHTIRGLAVSSRHPYLFSAGEDKLVKCMHAHHCLQSPSQCNLCVCGVGRLGLGVQQGDQALSRTPVGCVLYQCPSRAGPSGHRGQGLGGARVGHAHEASSPCAGRPHERSQLANHQRRGPPGDHWESRLYDQAVGPGSWAMHEHSDAAQEGHSQSNGQPQGERR